MRKRRIGEQSEDRKYNLYLQSKIGADFYTMPEWKRSKILTPKEFREDH